MVNSFVVHQKVVEQKGFLGNLCARPKTFPRAVWPCFGLLIVRPGYSSRAIAREMSGAWGHRAHGRKAAQPKAFQAKERLHLCV